MEGAAARADPASAEDIEHHISGLLQEGVSPSQAAKLTAKALGVSRNDAYEATVRLGKS